MSRYQVRWEQLIKDVKRRKLSDNTIGSLYRALEDADRIITAARGEARAVTQGQIAGVQEECGDTPARDSDSWFEEADEWRRQLLDALEQMDRANSEGYS